MKDLLFVQFLHNNLEPQFIQKMKIGILIGTIFMG